MARGFPRIGLLPTTTAVSRNVNLVVVKDRHDAHRRRAAECDFTHRHLAEAKARHAVHVFFKANPVETGAFVDVLRHGMLQEDALDAWIGVELVDMAEEPGRGR